MRCPRCGFDSPDEAECLRCGVVFAKLRPSGSRPGLEARQKAPSPRPPSAPEPSSEAPSAIESAPVPGSAFDDPEPDSADSTASLYTPPSSAVPDTRRPSGGLDREARRVLLVGLGLAVGVLAVPFLRFALSYIGVLVHELGHSAVSWAFGYPAVPALDFSYGGGMSLTFGRRPVLVVGSVLILVLLLGWAWRHPRWRWIAAGVVGLWILASVTAIHEVVVLAMGHGAELLFAALCLHRAITGDAVQRPVERPLYAMVGWFLVLEGTWFAWGLLTDPGRRQAYEDAKGGGHWMDFSRLAEDYFGVDLSWMAFLFLAACIAIPVAVLAVHGNRDRLVEWLMRRARRSGGGVLEESG